jgi:hypothetical protein
MTKLLSLNRRKISFVCCVVSLLLAAIFALSIRTNSQQLQVLNQKAKNAVLEQIKNSTDQPLRVVGNDDCPLRIVEVKVKEVSGPQFTELTQKTTNLETVSSVPEVELVNTSGKTITEFVIAIRDPLSRTTRTLVRLKLSLAPGGTYVVKRTHFVSPEQMAVANEDGSVRQTLVRPQIDSEKYWLQFARRSDIFITVGQVSFDDGSSWKIKEGGEVR